MRQTTLESDVTARRVSRHYLVFNTAFWLLFPLALVIICVVYAPALNLFFVQDDFVFLSRLAHVNNLSEWMRLLSWPDQFFRPMSRVAVLSIPFALFGRAPQGYHAFSILLHCLNAALVYGLLRCLRITRWSSLIGLVVYGLYPAHIMAVAWISGVQEMALTVFALAAAISFILSQRSARPASRLVFLVCSYLSYVCALLSKESAVLLPVWLVFFVLLNKDRISRSANAIATQFAGFAFIAVGYAIIRSSLVVSNPAYAFSFDPTTVATNLHLYFVDALMGINFGPIGAMLSFVVASGVTFLLLQRADSRINTILGLAWIFVFLIPVLPLANRHFSYYFSLSAVGVVLIIATGFDSVIFQRIVPNVQLFRPALTAALVLPVLIVNARAVRASFALDTYELTWKGARAQEIIDTLHHKTPRFETGSRLLVLSGPKEKLLDWVTGFGTLFSFYYPTLSEVIVVTDTGIFIMSPP